MVIVDVRCGSEAEGHLLLTLSVQKGRIMVCMHQAPSYTHTQLCLCERVCLCDIVRVCECALLRCVMAVG